MKAWRLHGIGDLRLDDVDIPSLGPSDVLVRVGACGICSSDIPRIFTKGTYHFPTIPGHEFSGLVTDVGSSDLARWLGKRVGVFPLIPCKRCQQCEAGHYEMCECYNYLGSRCDGGFAEYVRVPAWNLIELPDGIGWDEAALMEPAAVALHAVRAAIDAIDPSNASVVVSGSGAIGFLVVQWARILGFKQVVVVGRSNKKRALAEELGIAYIDSSKDAIPACDVAIDAVGSSASISACLECVNPGGKVVLLGNPSGDIALSQGAYWGILRKQLAVVGTWNSSYESQSDSEWADVLDAIANEKLNIHALISQRFGFDELLQALEIMHSGIEPYTRVVVMGR